MKRKMKAVKGWPGYFVSKAGEVFSRKLLIHDRGGRFKSILGGWHKLKPLPDHHGYLRVSLRRGGRSIKLRIHKIVLNAFIGKRPRGKEARHLNGNCKNNRLSNVRWGTPKQNSADRSLHGKVKVGEFASWSKLKESDVVKIRKLHAFGEVSHRSLGKRFGVASTTIQCILERRTWKHVL